MHNPFLDKLLSLQQDGKNAISSPSNWLTYEPLLEVPSSFDDEVNQLVAELSTSSTYATWHIFVGAPGNGKSAATGKIIRTLSDNFDIVLQDGRKINELNEGDVPYLIEIRAQGTKYPFCWIIQDASVVRDPYADDIDPAKELIACMIEAEERGISLVINTNRGVLEKAFRDSIKNGLHKQTWCKMLKNCVEDKDSDTFSFSNTGKNAIFHEAHFSHTTLDNSSLLINSNIFESLVKKATTSSNWEECLKCQVQELCPFKNNRDSLAREDTLANTLQILKRTELLSGQTIVFREANALISLLLSGCPEDYNGLTPCTWVHERVEHNDYFALLGRRLWNLLFSAYRANGLESDSSLRKQQTMGIREILKSLYDKEAKQAVSTSLNERHLSTSVGLNRLFSKDGLFAKIDPLIASHDSEFYGKWGSIELVLEAAHPEISPLEKKCFNIWKQLGEVVEEDASIGSGEFKWFSRWISANLVRFGAIVDGITLFAEELDELLHIITSNSMQIADLRQRANLEKELKEVLSLGDNKIQVSEHVALTGSWAITNLSPRIAPKNHTTNLGLNIVFNKDSNESEEVFMNAETFCWLKHKLKHKMSTYTFPHELLDVAIDAQSTAAAKSHYSVQPQGITLCISKPNGTNFTIKRVYNDFVDVREEECE